MSKNRKKLSINSPRVLTAMVIACCVFLAIYIGGVALAILFGVITLFGALELSNILGKGDSSAKFLYVLLAFLPWGLMLKIEWFALLYSYLLHISILILFILIINLWMKPLPYKKIGPLFSSLYWGLPFALAGYYSISNETAKYDFLGVILVIWTSDTFAYFTGKLIGKNKLFPSVSPGKTIEGSLGGGVFSVLVGYLFALYTGENITKWISIAIIVWIVGTLGDLVESKIKRVNNVKDSGSILPGHGGFLDRFDSLVMVIPFVLLFQLIVHYYN